MDDILADHMYIKMDVRKFILFFCQLLEANQLTLKNVNF